MTEHKELLQLFYSVLSKMKKEWSKELAGINHSQYLILKTLNNSGPQKASELSEVTQITPGAITGASDKLVSEGYAMRRGAEKDRRVVYLEITDKGKQLIESTIESQNIIVAKFFKGLPDEDINHLIRIYNRILDNLDR
jgi:DNA-binding MarR family transcriptional regulator